MRPFWVFSPSHLLDSGLVIAAARAGEIGIVDLTRGEDPTARAELLDAVVRGVGGRHKLWGVRWDLLWDDRRSPALLQDLPGSKWRWLVLGSVDFKRQNVAEIQSEAKELADQVFVEVGSFNEARTAEKYGFDGVIAKGFEAGGAVGDESTFILLQRLRNTLSIPYIVQGGLGPDTAAAALAAGASGVALSEQFWCAAETPFDDRTRDVWCRLDGTETHLFLDGGACFRFYPGTNRELIPHLQREVASGTSWQELIREVHLGSDTSADAQQSRCVAMGQEIGLASSLADRFVNVSGILAAYQAAACQNLLEAQQQRALDQESPFAADLGVEFPILQGPMTRVSDVTGFCSDVAENGALPFLALALMRGPEIERLLTETKSRMEAKPWGVGILGFIPSQLRNEQLAVIKEVRPPFALIAGGRPSQSHALEELGISTFLHVPSPGLLSSFLDDGARRVVLEGRECGGHVGPRGSFTLWQQAVDVLLSKSISNPEDYEIVFAGGIHDELSAAIVAIISAPLVRHGFKVGVLMGTGYLFTHEAVSSGAITSQFQKQALACSDTVLLESGVGHATRCVRTPFADEFDTTRRELIASGKSTDEVRLDLEMLSIGRLRLASKGVERVVDPSEPSSKGKLSHFDEETQLKRGMYMIGQLAALRDQVVPMRDLHRSVTLGATALLTTLKGLRRPTGTARRRRRPDHDIAIVGIAGMFPQARDVREFWGNIVNAVNAVEEVPTHRWRTEDYFSEERLKADQVYSRWGGFLRAIKFDPMRWQIPPASLNSIDPVQLLSLEVAWQALVDAGYDRRPYDHAKTGVIFAAAGSHDVGTDYCFRTMMRHYLPRAESLSDRVRAQVITDLEATLPEWTEDTFAGFLLNVIAGRVANRLNFGGANFTVDAACAASLAALDAAIGQLRLGAADAMLLGAVDVTNNPFCYMSFAKTHALSPRGRSRPFDSSADGIALGEAVAALMLKRLPDAERDGDRIYAVIKGIGRSSDGRNRSMTAPFPPGQKLAMTRAYEDAGVDPRSLTLIEAHGTGTVVGDGSEVTSLTEALGESGIAPRTVALGSVKSMIGHTKTAAGVASLVKTALALKQKVLPPTIGVEKPIEQLSTSTSPFYVNTETRPWLRKAADVPRRAGVSAFGFGGTNFHVVLEEYNGGFHRHDESDLTPRGAEIFAWQASERSEICGELQRLRSQLAKVDAADFHDGDLAELAQAVCLPLEGARSISSCRLAIVATSLVDLIQKVDLAIEQIETLQDGGSINEAAGVYFSEASPLDPEEVCFLYPGQGAQSVDMLRDLTVRFSAAAAQFEHADELLRRELPQPLSQYIYPPPELEREALERGRRSLNDTSIAQPALGAVELFASDLLASFGIKPGCAAGHSFGEYVALWAAGVFSRDDLLRIAAARGRVMAEAAVENPGGMAAVFANADVTTAVLDDLEGEVHIANRNSPKQTVIAGPPELLDRAVEAFADAGVVAKRVPVSGAFHTPDQQASAHKLAAFLKSIDVRSPRIPVSSNTTARSYPTDPAAIRKLLSRHLTEPVRFDEQVRFLSRQGINLFIEVGPGRILGGLARQNLTDTQATIVSLDNRDAGGAVSLAQLIGRCHSLGLPVRTEQWFAGRKLARSTVNDYFQRLAERQSVGITDWILTPGHARPALQGDGVQISKAIEEAIHQEEQVVAHRASRRSVKTVPDPISPSDQQAAPRSQVDQARQTNVEHGGANTERSPGLRPITVGAEANSSGSLPLENGTVQPRLISPAVSQTRMSQGTTMSTTNSFATEGASVVNGTSESGQALTLLSQFLELQIAQQRTLERVLSLCGTTAIPSAGPVATLPAPSVPVVAAPEPAPISPLAVSPTVTPATASVAPQAAAPVVARPPIPLNGALPSTVFTDGSNGGAAHVPTTTSPLQPVAKPEVSLGTAPASVSVSLQEVPSDSATDVIPDSATFRNDLLNAVSERTGYPVEALDETLPLESGLGIDSIKTLEIFSKLKSYHGCFRIEGEDEEELMTEFSRMKTLGDIVGFYEERRNLKMQGTDAPPSTSSASVVERHVLDAVEAVGGMEKKKPFPAMT